MKLRTHEAGLLGLIVGLLCICAAGPAPAQEFLPPPYSPMQMQPPLLAPTQPSMSRGIFYLSAGVRFRNVNTFRFDSVVHSIGFSDPGVPPFGPSSSGSFGTGTGITGLQAYPVPPDTTPPINTDPRVNGIWIYQNGFIDPNDPGAFPNFACDDTHTCTTGGSAVWPDPAHPEQNLGRFVVVNPSVAGGGCCNGILMPRNTGSFVLDDAIGQTNAATVGGTTAVSFTRVIDGTYNSLTFVSDPAGPVISNFTSNEVASQVFQTTGLMFSNDSSVTKFWAPSFEVGVQYSDYFDFFSGFSFYNFGDSVQKTAVTQAPFQRFAFTDAFPFLGTQAANWPVGGFNSATTILTGTTTTGDPAAQEYEIVVNGTSRGIFPTRTFFLVSDPSQPSENFQETIAHRADFNVNEWRFGGRSWFPIWGVGRLGFAAGPLLNFVYYKLAGSRQVVSLGPNLPPGTVVDSVVAQVSDLQFKFGGFFGTDFEVYLGRSAFLTATAEYNISDKVRYQLLSVQTEFDPGGFSSYLAAGLRF